MHEFRWSPGIGDPTFMGWLTVAVYFAVAWLCLRAFMAEKAGPPRPYRRAIGALLRVVRKHWPSPPGPARRAGLWLLLALGMAGLGVNKQLDLQTLMTELGRLVLRTGGWYEHRRLVQVSVIVTIAVLAVLSVIGLWWVMRRQLADFKIALTGVALLVAFIVIRATSFHEVDIFIGRVGDDIRMNWVLELGGLAIVGFAAGRRIRRAGAPLWRGWPRVADVPPPTEVPLRGRTRSGSGPADAPRSDAAAASGSGAAASRSGVGGPPGPVDPDPPEPVGRVTQLG